MKKSESSIRTCVACSSKSEKHTLLRWATDGTKIFPDWRQSFDGRSIYTCPRTLCVNKLYSMRSMPDKFYEGRPDFAISREEIPQFIKEQGGISLSHFLSLANKSGVLYLGQNAVIDEVKKNRELFAAVILSEDMAENAVHKITTLVSEKCRVIRFSTKQDFGSMFNTRPVGVLALKDSGMLSKILYYIEVISNFNPGAVNAD